MPTFGIWDLLVKKGGHILGYLLLALTLKFADQDRQPIWIYWMVCVGYALTDEYHQSFVAGRTSTIIDVLIYDQMGILLAYLSPRILELIRIPNRTLHR